ncbi:MAG: hypothetical protein EHM70_16595 [Chloroflexota bacterium]|nr:MAG: hypothetical protein EHM70_16595 [Chloroflexota bacterium]
MRPLEIILIILLFVYAVSRLWTASRRRLFEALPGLALLAAGLHLVFEGYRWQMVPLYALSAVTFTLWLVSRHLRRSGTRSVVSPKPGSGTSPGRRTPDIWRIAGSLGMLLLLAAASILPIVLPVPRLPRPTGPYAVGSYSTVLVDTSRQEIYSDNPSDPRRIILQVWYPAEESNGPTATLWGDDIDILGPAISKRFHFPAFSLDHLRLSHTYAVIDAPLAAAQSRYPVLLFSHGWNGFRLQNTYQAEDLASHGYVVVGVEHTYGAVVTIFPGGEVAYNNPATLPSGVSEAEFVQAANRLVDQWAGDLDFTLDTLETLDAQDPSGRFTGRLDLDKVGVFGHSTGGGATVEFCARDPRCKAGLGMDAYLTPVSPSVIDAGLDQPFLFLFSETWPSDTNNHLFDRLAAAAKNEASVGVIAGTGHYEFTDLTVFSPIAPIPGFRGSLPGERIMRIINDYSLAFFGKYLMGEEEPLLTGGSSDYPEVNLRILSPGP